MTDTELLDKLQAFLLQDDAYSTIELNLELQRLQSCLSHTSEFPSAYKSRNLRELLAKL